MKTVKNKILIILYIITGLVISQALLTFTLNHIVIPKIVMPELNKFIAANLNGPVKLTIKHISFDPISGFLMRDVELAGPVALKESYILRAKAVDVDMDFLPLLWKKLKIKRFDMVGVDLNVGRDAEGKWNFQPLLALPFLETIGGFDIDINEFTIQKGWIDYSDYLKKDSTIERRVTVANATLKKIKGPLYRLIISTRAQDKSGGRIELKMDYDKAANSATGSAVLDTRYLGAYWHYYLDDIFKPWHMSAVNVKTETDFIYKEGELLVSGRCDIDDSVLTYGDLGVKCDAFVKHQVKYVKDDPAKSFAKVDVVLKDLSSLSGEYTFLENGEAVMVITEKEITIQRLTGAVYKKPVDLSGSFIFGEPKELHLTGKISGSVETALHLRLTSDIEGELDWQAKTGDSVVSAHAVISNLKNMAFDLTSGGDIRLKDLSGKPGDTARKLSGNVVFSGRLKGEMDNFNSLDGNASVTIKDFSALDLKPVSLVFNLNIDDGLLAGDIPETHFCKGSLSGSAKVSLKKWGIELYAEKVDLAELTETNAEVTGTKGILSGNAACIGEWGSANTVRGAAYFYVSDCVMSHTPVLSKVAEGIESVTQTFKMPSFKDIEGNISVEDETISVEKIIGRAPPLTLTMAGKVLFSGSTDLTAGVQFQKQGFLRLARQILIPPTIGIDLIANCIQVKITGPWSSLKQETQLQPVAALDTFLPFGGKINPNKYKLADLWA
ncbi:MAG: AsmA family protein [Candidatus Omnitrophica bacterium]|nr:AsmA family protein [Candidatus Omnitrophota bacterium]